jgi:hypothetical protein
MEKIAPVLVEWSMRTLCLLVVMVGYIYAMGSIVQQDKKDPDVFVRRFLIALASITALCFGIIVIFAFRGG